jgi:hypothetical protein
MTYAPLLIRRRVNGVGQTDVATIVIASCSVNLSSVIAAEAKSGLWRLQRADLRIGIIEGSVCLLELLPVDADLVLSRSALGRARATAR